MKEKWLDILKKVESLALPYMDDPAYFFNETQKKVVYREYSKGGLTVHRGFYCPSPVIDIVKGGCNRGKLYKRMTAKSKPDYEYGFDENHRLITVCSEHQHNEFILWSGSTEIGISYEPGWGVWGISLCEYEHNRLVSFVNCGVDHAKRIHSGYVEFYQYGLEGLVVADMLQTFRSNNQWSIARFRYEFTHDEEGYLSDYFTYTYRFDGTLKPTTVSNQYQTYIVSAQ